MDFPQIPNTHALVMLMMTGVALFLFTREKIRLETSSLAILMMCRETGTKPVNILLQANRQSSQSGIAAVTAM